MENIFSNENVGGDSPELNPITEPNYNEEAVRETESMGAARGGQFIDIQELNIRKDELMKRLKNISEELSELNKKQQLLREKIQEEVPNSLEFLRLNDEINKNEIILEKTRETIVLNEEELMELDDQSRSLVDKN